MYLYLITVIIELISEIDSHFAIESASGFLQTEVVVQVFVCKVAAFERHVVPSVLKAVGEREIVGKLVRYDIVVVFRSDSGRIVSKAVQVLIVVSHGQHIALFPEVTPVERQVGIRKPVGEVRHPFPVGQVFGATGNGGLHFVAYVHLGKIAAYAYPVCEVVAGGKAKPLCLDLAVVDIGRRLSAATQISDVTLYVIFRITVDHSRR